jgi:hypothetical protein
MPGWIKLDESRIFESFRKWEYEIHTQSENQGGYEDWVDSKRFYGMSYIFEGF